MRNSTKYFKGMLAGLLVLLVQPALAADNSSSIFDSTLTITLLLLMVLLLIVIGILGYILLAAADIKKKTPREGSQKLPAAMMVIALIVTALTGNAQGSATATTVKAASTIGDMPASTFYIMVSVIFLELVIILGLLVNIRFLIKKEKLKPALPVPAGQLAEIRRNRLTWWDKINSLKPVSQEAELDLGHEYDGIRELNNRLPPWWLYGFYVTIIFAVIYLWRFHVSHTAPSSQEEYEHFVAQAEIDIKKYLKAKGESVDENTVTLLTAADDIDAGKVIFEASCAACHKSNGGGDVGPNLTDDYWIHGNDIQSVFKVIRYGVNAMPQWQNSYSNKQIAQVASYVKSLHGTNPPDAKAPQGAEIKEGEGSQQPATDTTKAMAANKK